MDRHDRAGAALSRLSRIMAELRVSCPWDREQTLESLKAYLLEETYELIDAIDTGGSDEHREELGDVLLQVVFQAEIRSERADFDLAGVADTIADKMIRRHPHVFSTNPPSRDEPEALEPSDVQANWESIKAQERAGEPSKKGRLSGVPSALPALLRAYRVGEKASGAGFDWPAVEGAWDKLSEELSELEEAMNGDDRAHLREELGDVLFALCNVARHVGVEPEDALRGATMKFQSRFEVIEEELDRCGERFEGATLDRLETLWELAKAREKRRSNRNA